MNWPRDRTSSTILIIAATGMAVSGSLLIAAQTPIWDIGWAILYPPPEVSDKWRESAFQGYYGAWIQAGGAVAAGSLAIIGGLFAYFGAIRAGRFTLDAAQYAALAQEEWERKAQAVRARLLAEDWLQKIRTYIVVGLMIPRFEVRDLKEGGSRPLTLPTDLPDVLTMDVTRIEPLGIAIVEKGIEFRNAGENLKNMYVVVAELQRRPETKDKLPSYAEKLELQIDEVEALGKELCGLLQAMKDKPAN